MSKITVPAERTVAEVTAWPDEVQIVVSAPDGNLTPDQARELARLLIEAADRSAHLDFEEDSAGEFKLVEKSPANA